ncbi:formylglycine-generating enzyme family protein [Patescibacteria group bacterium]
MSKKSKKKEKRVLKIYERVTIIIGVIVVTAIVVRAVDNQVSERLVGDSDSNGSCPQEMVYISSAEGGFCIDKYEASVGPDCPIQNPTSQGDTRSNIDYASCWPISMEQTIPWRNISQNQAALACAKAGKRLPTNKEWYLAALGTPDKQIGWNIDDCQVAKNWSSQPGLTGSGRNCVSGSGVYDMIGNVWEWVDGSVFNGSYKDRLLPETGYIKGVDDSALPSETDGNKSDANYYHDYFWVKSKGTRGMARGGYWDNESDAGQYALYAVTQPSFASDGVGFRCVK